jgi:hypothetical protein
MISPLMVPITQISFSHKRNPYYYLCSACLFLRFSAFNVFTFLTLRLRRSRAVLCHPWSNSLATMNHLFRPIVILLAAVACPLRAQDNPLYTTFTNFDQVLKTRDARYASVTRVSDPGTREHPVYTGFFFYQVLQFDATGRYAAAMKVYCENREVRADDRADVGFIDFKDGNKWTKIGQTTAWNWQQGARLQWRPRSDEIVWNDRAADGKSFVCRVYNFRTRAHRTLPRAIYDLSPDGSTALTHDFERMNYFHGTEYVGLDNPYEKVFAPSQTGVWKMNMDTGKSTLVISLEKMAKIIYPPPKQLPSSGYLYFFREGWNPSGTRFIAFVKDPFNNNRNDAYTMTPDGNDVRFFYHGPSHHSWQDDSHLVDFGRHEPPNGGPARNGYFLFQDDGTGKAKELLWPVDVNDGNGGNGHDSYPGPGADWIISDTYPIDHYQYLFLFHRPTKQFVPLARLKSTADWSVGDGMCRVDLHPRFTRDGRLVCIDSTHESLGRQMYVLDIGYILDHPPTGR